ncbi:MAG: succinate dehydrogenase [Pseudomonadota bacterium]|nr:succinate dehydrogenase [Pseudomonadota bacterium]
MRPASPLLVTAQSTLEHPDNDAVRRETLLWLASRASAAVLALCVVVHLATMIVAVRAGLTAADILGRTRGSISWALFYGVFVLAVAVHAPLGLRTMVTELARRGGRVLDACMGLLALLLLVGGIRAVAAVILT